MRLFEVAGGEGISFIPGSLFSATGRYAHCLRLSFSGAWGDAEKQALSRLGQMAHALLEGR
jgi:DNA-binding transcriptional MocR family regulator